MDCFGKEEEGVNEVHDCDTCYSTLCDQCRVRVCQSQREDYDCKACAKIISHILLEENKKMQAQIKVFEDENKVLKDEVEGLMGELSRVRVSSQPE